MPHGRNNLRWKFQTHKYLTKLPKKKEKKKKKKTKQKKKKAKKNKN